ncbi:MAG: hypothetical protein IH795_00430 [Bacteroidetes bacterium]|nr:hypothetical protein [Bacteroidota bacterium]
MARKSKGKPRLKKQGRSGSSKRVVFVSDMHVGSAMAVAPPDPFVSDIDTNIKSNKIMKVLYETWVDCIDSLSGKPDVLGIIGEPMDGANKKQIGQQSWTTNLNDQVQASSKLLKLLKAENIIMVRGSGYHVQIDATNFEEQVARLIGASRYRAYLPESVQIDLGDQAEGALTDYFAYFDVNNKVFNMTHHIGYSKNEMYRTTAMARELVTSKLQEDFYGKADVYARGHVHYFVKVEYAHTQGFTNPAWKLPDAHLFRHGLGGTKPDIGMVECIVEPNEDVLIKKHLVEVDIKPLVKQFA